MHVVLLLALSVSSLEPATAPSTVELPSAERVALYQFLAGAAAAAAAAPLTLILGTWIGSSSPNLLGALIPSIVLLLALPPVIVTGATYWAGDVMRPGT